MDYITVAQLRSRLKTDLDDGALSDIIAEESALITVTLSAEPADPMVEELPGGGTAIWLTYRPSVVQEVRDVVSDTVIDPATYLVRGRALVMPQMVISDLDFEIRSATWPERVRVTYSIAGLADILAILRGVCLDLCRLAITDMGAEQSERLGDYQHDSKDVQAERKKVLARLNRIKGLRPVMAG
ncbi:MAG TPA: hypothetical protein GXX40_05670 [Firmicutes bacterium]|nr:hypothetical protein [Bacillota bacterium]